MRTKQSSRRLQAPHADRFIHNSRSLISPDCTPTITAYSRSGLIERLTEGGAGCLYTTCDKRWISTCALPSPTSCTSRHDTVMRVARASTDLHDE